MLVFAAILAAWEGYHWERRLRRRRDRYDCARALATALGRPLVVIGAPDRGATSGYPPGDITIDIGPSNAPNFIQADICDHIPLDDDSCVILCSCVLEYVGDVDAALDEIDRVSGGHAVFVGVEPWTLTASFYPGRRRVMPTRYL